MRILAIDTSTSVMGVSLLDENKIYAEIITNLKKNHSVRLMPSIDQIFTEVNWEPESINLIAVAKGPGSYTGVRIGVTTAKTLSWALKAPLIGVSTLETMAYEHYHFQGLISPILDARRGQVYTGLYKNHCNWENVEEDKIIMMEEWLHQLKEYNQKIIFVGDDTILHQELIHLTMKEKGIISQGPFHIPRPSIVGLLGHQKYLNDQADNTFDFVPAYIQLPEAEVKWRSKNKGEPI